MKDSNQQIILFTSDDGKITVNTQFDTETAWLSLDQMATLFGRDKSTISRHIKKRGCMCGQTPHEIEEFLPLNGNMIL